MFIITVNSIEYYEKENYLPDMDIKDANIEFTFKPNTWTNGNVEVIVSNNDSKYVVQLSKDAENWTTSNAMNFDENRTIYARLKDPIGRVSDYASRKISIIDKEKPLISTALTSTSQTTNSISLSIGATDTLSGLGKVEWYYGTTNNPTTLGATTSITTLNENTKGPTTAQTKEQTINGLASGTTYYFKAVVYDVAGNQASSTVIRAKTKNPTAGDISYTPSDSSWKVDNVKSALDYFLNK